MALLDTSPGGLEVAVLVRRPLPAVVTGPVEDAAEIGVPGDDGVTGSGVDASAPVRKSTTDVPTITTTAAVHPPASTHDTLDMSATHPRRPPLNHSMIDTRGGRNTT